LATGLSLVVDTSFMVSEDTGGTEVSQVRAPSTLSAKEPKFLYACSSWRAPSPT